MPGLFDPQTTPPPVPPVPSAADVYGQRLDAANAELAASLGLPPVPSSSAVLPPVPPVPPVSAVTGLFSPAVPIVEAPVVPPVPARTPEQREVAIVAAKARLLAEDAATLARIPQTMPTIGAVNPPDAPPLDMRTAASPVPPEAASQIQDPELRARVERHIADVQAQQQSTDANKPPVEKKDGRCDGGVGANARVMLTAEEASSKKKLCHVCGKKLAIKPSADKTEATLPPHNRLKTEDAGAPPPLPPGVPPLPSGACQDRTPPSTSPVLAQPPPLPPEAYRAPDALPGQTTIAQTVALPVPPVSWVPKLDIVLCIDMQPVSLGDYARTIALEVAAANGNTLPANWQAKIAVAVKRSPPPAGAYYIGTVSAIDAAVAEALVPLCASVVRGVK